MLRSTTRLTALSRRLPYRNQTLCLGASAFHSKSVSLMGARILISEPIHPLCPQILQEAGHDVTVSETKMTQTDLIANLPKFDGLIIRSGTVVDKEVLSAAPNLKLLARAGTGVDNIDLVKATQLGVMVMNSPFGNTVSVAELTVGLLTSVSRCKPSGVESPLGAATCVSSSEIHNKTLGIIGLGRIGKEVAKRCQALGMNVIGYDPIVSAAVAKSIGIEPLASLDELFARSDYITLHIPLNANTKHIVNAHRLSLCKNGIKFINGARSKLIEPIAFCDAMEVGKVAGLAMDSDTTSLTSDAWKKLLAMPNVLITPHIGSLTSESQQRIAIDVAGRFNDVLAGRSMQGVVNAPTTLEIPCLADHLPYLSLAEKLGSMQAQLLDDSPLRRIEVGSEGRRITSSDLSDHLVSAVLKGLLSHMFEEEVTLKNARKLADSAGIQWVEHKREEVSNNNSFTNVLTVTFETANGKKQKLTATVLGKNQLRLIGFNDYSMDVLPSGPMLLFYNQDQPGVLHSVTSLLAKHKVNIGCFGLAREKLGGKAVGVVNVDDSIPDEVMDELATLKLLSNVRRVNLMDLQIKTTDNEPELQEQVHDSSTNAVSNTSNRPKPVVKPSSPNFGSGPCKKRPGYSLANISETALGRSHRSVLGKGLLSEAIVKSKRILGLPDDYLLGIVPASDTGAFEMAMWNMLGERPVDVCYWESFGQQWYKDAVNELGLSNVTDLGAPFGEIANFSAVNKDHDVLFTWNGTTSGVKTPNGDWIADDRTGLVFNDATSAAFAMDIPWSKIDVCTFSWQKVLGGEGGHGVLILSPRAVERLESYVPSNRPMPKIFRLTSPKTGKLLREIFDGSTINTPSMLCVEDYLDALRWTDSVGGVQGLKAISETNLGLVETFVAENNDWITFLAKDKSIRSNTSVCLQIKGFSKQQVKTFTKLLESENVAVDIGSYRDAPPGIRIWCGATVETKDVEALLPWLKWAYLEVKGQSSS